MQKKNIFCWEIQESFQTPSSFESYDTFHKEQGGRERPAPGSLGDRIARDPRGERWACRALLVVHAELCESNRDHLGYGTTLGVSSLARQACSSYRRHAEEHMGAAADAANEAADCIDRTCPASGQDHAYTRTRAHAPPGQASEAVRSDGIKLGQRWWTRTFLGRCISLTFLQDVSLVPCLHGTLPPPCPDSKTVDPHLSRKMYYSYLLSINLAQ